MASNNDKFPPTVHVDREPIAKQNLAMGNDENQPSERFPNQEEYPVYPDESNYTDEPARSTGEGSFDDPDRLPWLETAESYDDASVSPTKIAGIILGALALIALAIGGIWWLKDRDQGVGLGDGTGELIAKPEGDYKVAPTDAQGRSFEGEGDVAQATADGRDVTTVKPAQPGEATPIAPATDSKAGAAATAAAAAAAGTGLVQLGAYNDTAGAEKMWTALSTRYPFLASYQKKITQATVEGRQVFRLNVVTSTPDAARELCTQIKAAGSTCLIPR